MLLIPTISFGDAKGAGSAPFAVSSPSSYHYLKVITKFKSKYDYLRNRITA